ncbi:unnamed protein product [Urochloa humidicola]
MEAAAITALLPKLAAMLTAEYALHSGVAAGIRYLQDELTSMQAFLEAAPPAGHFDDGDDDAQLINLWARTVRELAYDADDTVDSYLVRVACNPPPPPPAAASVLPSAATLALLRAVAQRCKARRRIAVEIERIKREVMEASDRRRRFSVPAGPRPRSPTPAAADDPRVRLWYENSARLVGMGRPMEELAHKLCLLEAAASTADGGGEEGEEDAQSQRLKMVSVVGAGGIGKTTLVREVYGKFREKFDCGAFVSVSQNPDMKIVLGRILRQVSQISCDAGEIHHYWGEEEIIERIRDVLEDKR